MGDKGKGEVKAPDLSKEYEEGLKTYLKYLPKELRQEYQYRQKWDPKFIEQALAFQHKYDPQQAAEQLAALQRRDPEWLAIHGALGEKIRGALERGYLDPRQEAAYQRWSEMAGRGEPTRDRAYEALGEQVTGDTLRGGTASPEVLRQMTQAIMAQRPGLSYGEAQDMATAVYTGQRSEALKSQRQQVTGQFLQTATPTAQREQSLGAFYGQAPPQQNVLGLAGTYIQPSNSVVNALNQVQGVQAPRSFGYVNPNAGYQGVQFGLQNYQNQLAQQQMGGGGGNPWTQALQGAGTGASIGSATGNPYVAAGGAVLGAAAGAFGYPQFSDHRWKMNISRAEGETPDGIPLVEYDYDGKRWRGVLAQDVLKVRPDAVVTLAGGRLGVFYSKLGVQVSEIGQAKQEGT